jgi:hypothetical protein
VRPLRALLVAVVMATMIATSCAGGDSADPPPTTVGTGPGGSVVVLGDSISDFSRSEIVDAFGGEAQVEVLARVGGTFESSQAAADEVAASDPRVVVVELGTNDVWSRRPLGEVTEEADELLAKFPESCVVIVTLNEQAVEARSLAGVLYDNQAATALNDELRRRADELVDWSQAANRDRASYLDQGTIHPTPSGRALLAGLMKDAADRCAA